MNPPLVIHAPAKLNLALSVGAPGVDGMHPICSWMIAVNLTDELTVTPLEEDRFSRYAILWHSEARRRSDINWPITSDLAVRAHLALEDHVGRKLPVQLKLAKRIPVGGGLGGGSSDAAAMLLTINALFELRIAMPKLMEIGAALGSDVPFLIHAVSQHRRHQAASAIVEGLGEKITPQEDAPDLHAVLVFPDIACPTREVYQRFDQLTAKSAALRPPQVSAAAAAAPAPPQSEQLFNDLTEPAMAIAPALRDIQASVAKLAERPAHLSGSGSTLFVLCDEELHAQHLAGAIERQLRLPAVAAGSHPG